MPFEGGGIGGSVIELSRHGRRHAYEEELSAEGIEKIKEKAVDVYDDILRHSLGSIFYVVSSSRSRACDTKEHLEGALKELAFR